eukprot:1255450-Amorphochlora_amoeboformis.AAC.1
MSRLRRIIGRQAAFSALVRPLGVIEYRPWVVERSDRRGFCRWSHKGTMFQFDPVMQPATDLQYRGKPQGWSGPEGLRINRASIIGAGSVGATIASFLISAGAFDEVCLIDTNKDRVQGQ